MMPSLSVVHTAPCLDAEVYTHRSGRTGRAGRKGRSLQMVPLKRQGRVRRQLAEAGVDVAEVVVDVVADGALEGALEGGFDLVGSVIGGLFSLLGDL